VRCDVDLDRNLIFLAYSEHSESLKPQMQVGDLNFYIDPDGDDSLSNSGATESPFKTLAGARDAVNRRYIMTSLGVLNYNINPGTYELSPADKAAMEEATHPREIRFSASDPTNKPLLISDRFAPSNGHMGYYNLRLSGNNNYVIYTSMNAVLTLSGVETIARSPMRCPVFSGMGSIIYVKDSMILNGGGYALQHAIGCHWGTIHFVENTQTTLVYMPSVHEFAYCNDGHLFIRNVSFAGSTSGQRYLVINGGVINTVGSGSGYFPGDVAGTAGTGGQYV
ncbi:MAG: hypothetical protein LIP23_01375, partial [Planctomycetes bacterium]|nr:hypothetical protein [Planctomycetota bacterium]